MSDGETYIMQDNYPSRSLVTIDNEQSIVNVYSYAKCKNEEAFIMIKRSKKWSVTC